ncbi:MAG: glycosyltransferase family 2 protein [Chordicoccus sp.]
MGDRQYVYGAVRETSQGARGAGISGVLLLSDACDVATYLSVADATCQFDYGIGIAYMTGMVSIIIPAYNAAKHIGKCIKSVQSQTYSRWNLIIVDDGSLDQTSNVIKEYQKKDHRIHLIRQSNTGEYGARRTGLFSNKCVESEYAMFVDADDILPRNALSALIDLEERYQADIVCGKALRLWKNICFDGYTAPCFHINEPRVYDKSDIIRELLISFFGYSNFPVSLWGKLFRRDLLLNHYPVKSKPMAIGEDLLITLQCVYSADRIVITPADVYEYRTGGVTSRFIPTMMDDFLWIYHFKETYLSKYKMPQDAQLYMDIELINVFYSYIRSCRYDGKIPYEKIMLTIKRYSYDPTLIKAAKNISNRDSTYKKKADAIIQKDYDAIYLKAVELSKSELIQQRIRALIRLAGS